MANGRWAKKRMIAKIRTTIWKNQEKSATKKAMILVKTQLAEEILRLSLWRRIKLAIKGTI